jgi:hypothetical protein
MHKLNIQNQHLMRKTILLFSISLLLFSSAYAQRLSLGLGTCLSQYVGDIRDESASAMLRPTASFGFHNKTAGRLHWSFNAADDKDCYSSFNIRLNIPLKKAEKK